VRIISLKVKFYNVYPVEQIGGRKEKDEEITGPMIGGKVHE
jgi:hypothetical protein